MFISKENVRKVSMDLYKISKSSWAVKNNDDVQGFSDIESASSYLESMGVVSDEIDVALINMSANNHSRAQFGVNGTFMFSDDEKLRESIGTA